MNGEYLLESYNSAIGIQKEENSKEIFIKGNRHKLETDGPLPSPMPPLVGRFLVLFLRVSAYKMLSLFANFPLSAL